MKTIKFYENLVASVPSPVTLSSRRCSRLPAHNVRIQEAALSRRRCTMLANRIMELLTYDRQYLQDQWMSARNTIAAAFAGNSTLFKKYVNFEIKHWGPEGRAEAENEIDSYDTQTAVECWLSKHGINIVLPEYPNYPHGQEEERDYDLDGAAKGADGDELEIPEVDF